MTKKSLLFILFLAIGIFQVHAQIEENEELEDFLDESSGDLVDDIGILTDDEDLNGYMSGSGEEDEMFEEIDVVEEETNSKPVKHEDGETKVNEIPEVDPETPSVEPANPNSNSSFLKNSAFMAAIIIGGSLGLLLACCVFLLVVYRLRKKDQGSYPIDDKKPSSGYQYTQGQEYYA